MPTIEVNRADLDRLLGEKLSTKKLEKSLRNLGMEVEGKSISSLKLEAHHNRPDLLGVEGIARSLKGYLGIEKGLPDYDLKDPEMILEVDPSLGGSRPVAVMGQIENADLDDISLKSMMELQEKLHEILGRDRQKISIGAYDISDIKPPIHYTTTDPDGKKFVPLEFEEELTPQEILEKHPKGQKYRHLIEEFDKYPLLVDSEDTVLSMPPIINSETTRLTSDVEKIGVDVTGIDRTVANQAMVVFLTAAAERGFDIRSFRVKNQDGEFISPDMDNGKMSFKVKEACKKLGLDLGSDKIENIVEKMRYEVVRKSDEEIEVKTPSYRFDLMHQVDLFEDIAIGYGYDELEPTLPAIEIAGEPHPIEETSKIARRTLTGFGFMEVMPYLLTSPELNFESMLTDGEAVTIENPVSKEYSILRTWLLPGLLDALRENKQHELPQRVFEVSDVVLLDEEAETGAKNFRRAAAAIIGEEVDFTQARSYAEGLLRELDIEWKVKPFNHRSLLSGRAAEFLIDGGHAGFVGEVHPEVIQNFDLENPIACFEIDLPE